MGYSSIRDPNGSTMPRLAARAYPLMEGGAEPSESPSKAERTGYRHRHPTGTGGARSRASTDATAQPHRARHATAVGSLSRDSAPASPPDRRTVPSEFSIPHTRRAIHFCVHGPRHATGTARGAPRPPRPRARAAAAGGGLPGFPFFKLTKTKGGPDAFAASDPMRYVPMAPPSRVPRPRRLARVA